MSSAFNNLNNIDLSKIPDATNLKFGIAISKWNKEITDNLLNGCVDLLKSKGVLDENIIISHVPGSFELIYASKKLQLQDVNSVIAIGNIIRGETMHFDFICNATSNGIKDLNISGKCPVIFCVLTDDNIQQSIDRSGGDCNW